MDFQTAFPEESMAAKQEKPKESCPCSQGIDRRDFLKAAAMAGLLAGCNPVLETLAPTDAPTVTAKPTPAPNETMIPDLKGKKVLYVLPRAVYAVQCHEASSRILKNSGVSIVLAALEKKEIGVWGGGTPSIMPDLTLGDAKPDDYDAVIFECGQPQETFNPDYQNFAQETAAQGKVLGAICMMPAILAAAGLLEGKKATSNVNDQYVLEQFGAVISDLAAVRDGKFVTAGFEGNEQFGWLIVEALAESG
jgi:putative intracellular protease/amidase